MEDQKPEDSLPVQKTDDIGKVEDNPTNIAEKDNVPESIPESEQSLPTNTEDTATPEQPISAEVKKNRFSKKTMLTILVALIVLLAGGLGYYYYSKSKKTNTNTVTPVQNTNQASTDKITEPALDPALKKLAEPTTGETWLPARKPVADLGYIKTTPGDGTDIKYYEVGARAGNTIYLSSYYELGEIIYLYEKSPTGEVKMIGRPSSTAVYNDDIQKTTKDSLSSKVKFDETIHYDSLSVPNKISLKSGYDLTLGKYTMLGTTIDEAYDKKSNITYTELAKYGGSSLQKSEFPNADTHLTSITYFVKLPIGTRMALDYEPLTTDMSKMKFSTGSATVGDTLASITEGCGRLLSSVSRADQAKDGDFKAVGQSDAGQKIYEAVDPNYILVNKSYQEFKDFYTDDPVKKSTTKDDFIKNHAIVFFKDNENQWLVYTRVEYRAVGGCAKPVVYLYPTVAQNVSVKIGADVKVSDPLYDSVNGWKNVWADPSGLLSYNGKNYDSLFWEGPGYGQYPAINSGTVVKTSDAIGTIRSQLAEQGFNAKEINDFVTYWAPNLPNKPYVRLSWLNTEQMNHLAPINITPSPDTIIRTFLDFKGLDNPVKIPAQNFVATPRVGFTVTEWGGLSSKKLY